MFPPSDRCKPIVKALLAYPDAGTEAEHLEIFRGVAQVVRSAVGDRQQLGNLVYPVDKRHELGCLGLVRRFYGRGYVRSFVRNCIEISDCGYFATVPCLFQPVSSFRLQALFLEGVLFCELDDLFSGWGMDGLGQVG